MQFSKPLPFRLCLPNTLSLGLPVRLGPIQLVQLDMGAFPQQVCADFADPWHVFADDVVVSIAWVMEEWSILLSFNPKFTSRNTSQPSLSAT